MKEVVIKISDDDYCWLKQVSEGYTSYPCTLRLYEAVKNGILLEDIKAEIKEERECAYADFEQYKVEYLGQDWEDVLDSLPHDDFRYGMERTLEIINRKVNAVTDD